MTPNVSAGYLSANMVTLQVFFSKMQSTNVEIVPAYSFMALLSDIGGALGLMLGATLLTAFEVADFTTHVVADVIRLSRDQKRRRCLDNKHNGDINKKISSRGKVEKVWPIVGKNGT